MGNPDFSPGFTLIEVIAVIVILGISIYSFYTALLLLHERNNILNQQKQIRVKAQLYMEEAISYIDEIFRNAYMKDHYLTILASRISGTIWTKDGRQFKVELQEFDQNEEEMICITIKISPYIGDSPSIVLKSEYYYPEKSS